MRHAGLSDKLQQHVDRLGNEFAEFFTNLHKMAKPHEQVPKREEAYLEWMTLKMAALQLSLENVIEVLNKVDEVLHATTTTLDRIQMN